MIIFKETKKRRKRALADHRSVSKVAWKSLSEDRAERTTQVPLVSEEVCSRVGNLGTGQEPGEGRGQGPQVSVGRLHSLRIFKYMSFKLSQNLGSDY